MLISEKHPRIIVDDECGVAGYWPYAVNVIYLLNGVYLSEDENTTVIKRLVDYKQKLREYQDDEEAFAGTEFVVHCNPPPMLGLADNNNGGLACLRSFAEDNFIPTGPMKDWLILQVNKQRSKMVWHGGPSHQPRTRSQARAKKLASSTIRPTSGSDKVNETINIIDSLNKLWANFEIKLDHKTCLKVLIWIAEHDRGKGCAEGYGAAFITPENRQFQGHHLQP
jgi:hypothetical protein